MAIIEISIFSINTWFIVLSHLEREVLKEGRDSLDILIFSKLTFWNRLMTFLLTFINNKNSRKNESSLLKLQKASGGHNYLNSRTFWASFEEFYVLSHFHLWLLSLENCNREFSMFFILQRCKASGYCLLFLGLEVPRRFPS